MEQLQNIITEHPFGSEQDEIHFFKSMKPLIFSKLIYYLKIYRLRTKWPFGSVSTQKKFIQEELKHIRQFFDDNQYIIQYYRSGQTSMDRIWFARGHLDNYLGVEPYYFSTDPTFNTTHDYIVSQLLANELLGPYLIFEIEQLKHTKLLLPTSNPDKCENEVWTAKKSYMVEMIYALQSFGAFNNGKMDIKALAECFEKAYHVELGNYYQIFQEICLRKKNRTIFLDQLKESLIKRMDEADENYNPK